MPLLSNASNSCDEAILFGLDGVNIVPSEDSIKPKLGVLGLL